MNRQDAVMRERRDESKELQKVLQSDASAEEKRQAMESFRAKREAQREQTLSKASAPTTEERAASHQRMKEVVQRMPKERREIMEARLAFSEEMEKFQAEEKSLSSEERQMRRQQLMDRRREASERQLAMMEAKVGQSNSEQQRLLKSPYQRAVAAEKKKLDTAMTTKNPEQRREAMEKFRAAMNELRETRMREMERRTEQEQVPTAK